MTRRKRKMDFLLPKYQIISPSSSSHAFPSIPSQLPLSFSSRKFFSHRISCQKMSSERENVPRMVKAVNISFSELENKAGDLSWKIESGFGPNGLGIISVSDVPGYPLLRRSLLRLSPRLANLPEEVKQELEDPDSRYNFGWSHGKEELESGKLDTLKGSFYANPMVDTPTTEAFFMQRYPSYCRPNIWPTNALPELEVAFKALGKLMFDIGLMVAYHCDKYVSKTITTCSNEGLERILLRSRCHKGRLLYYFPVKQSNSTQEAVTMSSWCGWHTDHGSLTGLTCGMFTKDGVEMTCSETSAGLHIKTRSNQIVKVDDKPADNSSGVMSLCFDELETLVGTFPTTSMATRVYSRLLWKKRK